MVGAFGLAAFAVVGYLSFGHLTPVLVLVLALLAWAGVACGMYLLLWAPSHGLLRDR